MLDLVFIALLQAVAGDPAAPADPAQAAPPATTEQPADQTSEPAADADEGQDEVRCRREPVVGTRLSRRICTTAAQDQAMREDARNMVNRAQSQSPSRSN
jgi:hypothetical protein